MPELSLYRLRVLGAQGTPDVLELRSTSAVDALQQAARMGLAVQGVEQVGVTAVRRPRAGRFSLLLFSQELLALLEAGLHLHEALRTLAANAPAGDPRAGVLAALLAGLDEGQTFSAVLATQPQVFPAVFVALVQATERTGDLPQALARYIAYTAQFAQLNRKLQAAALYPAVLVVVGTVVAVFLLTYVMPRFAQVYGNAGRSLPWLSSLLLQAGELMARHGLVLGLLAAALLAWLLHRLRRGDGWSRLGELATRLPGVAPHVAQFRLARCMRALGLLMAAGVPLPRALQMARTLLAGAQQQALDRARQLVEQGRPLSQALQLQGLASAVTLSLLAVGERSGRLAEMLERSARFHDDELERWLDATARLAEPVLMLVIGVVVGGLVLLMYMPIFDLVGGL